MGMKGGGIKDQGLLWRLQETPEGSGLVYAEGFQIRKVGCARFAHGGTVLASCGGGLLGPHTIHSTGRMKVFEGLMA